MSFYNILRELVEGVDGGVAAVLMGMDGLSVQQYSVKEGYDIESLAVEYGKAVDEIKKAAAILNLGGVEEVLIRAAASDIVIRVVTSEYYLAFVVRQGAGVGKAGYMSKKAASKIRPD
ncbi:MAG: hypothetical protein HZB84_07575 [Deltaproteobacteria bacterium]|nr:hypothetical protein [Deltaproteobacteria bacterium]